MKDKPEEQAGSIALANFFLGRLSIETNDPALGIKLGIQAHNAGEFDESALRDLIVCYGREAQFEGADVGGK